MEDEPKPHDGSLHLDQDYKHFLFNIKGRTKSIGVMKRMMYITLVISLSTVYAGTPEEDALQAKRMAWERAYFENRVDLCQMVG